MKLLNELNKDDIIEIQQDNKKFDKMVTLNRGFIEVIINPFRQNFNYDDMYQTAIISLWKAINKYNPEKEDASAFSTFARTVIQRDVWGYTKKQNKIFQNENSMESYINDSENNNTSEYNETYFKKPKDKEWTPEELELLKNCVGKYNPKKISKIFKERGFTRGSIAISVKLICNWFVSNKI